jgi:hypothetical protein
LGGFDAFEFVFHTRNAPDIFFLEGELHRDLFQRKVRRVKSFTCVPVYWDTFKGRYPLELRLPAHTREWIWVMGSTQSNLSRTSEFECIVRHSAEVWHECGVRHKVRHGVLE